MTQAEFAERVGVKPNSVSRWVNGRLPNGTYIRPIASALMLDEQTVAKKTGFLNAARHDPESAEAQLISVTGQVEWTDDRLKSVLAVLMAMGGQDREGA